MDGLPRSSTARRLHARASRVAIAAVVAVVAIVATPGAASAKGAVTPILDCHVANSDGSRTFVFGYDNPTGSTVTIPAGPHNSITPKRYGPPPTTIFRPGVHHGVFSVTVTGDEGPVWHLQQNNVGSASACPSSTELPGEGNGTGPAIGLAAAGLVGGVLVHRANRRARALAGAGRADA